MIDNLLALTFPGGKTVNDQIGTNTFINKPVSNVGDFVTALLYFAILLGGFISVLYFLFGAVRFITSGGDPKAVSGAKGQIVGAIVGFLIVLAAYMILQFLDQIIGGRLTDLIIPSAYAANIGDYIRIGGGTGSTINQVFPDLPSFGEKFATLIIRLIFAVGFIAAFIVIILGGIKYMTASGDEKAIGDARRMIALAIVGLLLLFGAMIFLGIIQALTFIPFIKSGPVIY